ncbi:hypothetical protein CGMCC3_g6976 [Colletotrichum fructicola]|nr:uncharacterized protein CGMCC3_g6976 [Colletotrichum fructicola]KAE9577093.1 hypothetical protein CGMCC3_g6976 [Colletotrichum fructicola]
MLPQACILPRSQAYLSPASPTLHVFTLFLCRVTRASRRRCAAAPPQIDKPDSTTPTCSCPGIKRVAQACTKPVIWSSLPTPPRPRCEAHDLEPHQPTLGAD